MTNIERLTALFCLTVLTALILVACEVSYTMFEDGSFVISGCAPWNICAH